VRSRIWSAKARLRESRTWAAPSVFSAVGQFGGKHSDFRRRGCREIDSHATQILVLGTGDAAEPPQRRLDDAVHVCAVDALRGAGDEPEAADRKFACSGKGLHEMQRPDAARACAVDDGLVRHGGVGCEVEASKMDNASQMLRLAADGGEKPPHVVRLVGTDREDRCAAAGEVRARRHLDHPVAARLQIDRKLRARARSRRAAAVTQHQPHVRIGVGARGWSSAANRGYIRRAGKDKRMLRGRGVRCVGEAMRAIKARAPQQCLPLPHRNHRLKLPNVAVLEQPPARQQTEHQRGVEPRPRHFQHEQQSARAEQAADAVERAAEIARRMQHVGGDDEIERMRLDALFGGVALDIERTAFDEREAREALLRVAEETGGYVGEHVLRRMRRQHRQKEAGEPACSAADLQHAEGPARWQAAHDLYDRLLRQEVARPQRRRVLIEVFGRRQGAFRKHELQRIGLAAQHRNEILAAQARHRQLDLALREAIPHRLP